ncbi:hypothetical protein AB868_00091 [Serratia marcescens]|uniref:Uncharacterized protein n=1 Tax=Serratia marcescens TaxID=615 RepID=A0A656VQP6_SERMA|nr:hypothetical protein AB868_00091 [Serratia marcescens]
MIYPRFPRERQAVTLSRPVLAGLSPLSRGTLDGTLRFDFTDLPDSLKEAEDSPCGGLRCQLGAYRSVALPFVDETAQHLLRHIEGCAQGIADFIILRSQFHGPGNDETSPGGRGRHRKHGYRAQRYQRSFPCTIFRRRQFFRSAGSAHALVKTACLSLNARYRLPIATPIALASSSMEVAA